MPVALPAGRKEYAKKQGQEPAVKARKMLSSSVLFSF
jgi:hypothetical protein